MILRGIAASDGIGIGKAVCVREQSLDYSAVKYSGKEVEKDRLQSAITQFNEKTTAMAERIRAQVGEKESEILTGQIMMLSDPFMQSQMTDIIDGGQCAEAAVDQVCTMYAEMFAGVDDELMRQRATDVRDIRSRMLAILLGVTGVDVSSLPAGSVLVAHDLTPSMTVGLDKEHVAAILTEVGGRTSHSAILARALELPAVLSVPRAMEQLKDGDSVIVDGGDGVALVNPDQRTLAEYLTKQEAFRKQKALLAVYRDKATVDAEGNRYALYANIGSPAEAEAAAASGAEGIGLFRTEFLYMNRAEAPDEATQYQAYRQVCEELSGKPVIIRTLDVGGDKDIPYLHLEPEDNPFLGCRAVRYCLRNPDTFRTQLTALMKAGAERDGQLWVMLPMVATVTEFKEVRALAEDIAQQTGLPLPKLGTMIETPAAMLMADVLAKYCDFFSIGTNDLIQYLMAADRGNPNVAYLYQACDPAVLRALRSVIQAGVRAGIPVGLCGEMASDALLIPVLLGFGLERFSVSPSAILNTRREISRWSIQEAQNIADHALTLETAAEVAAYLNQVQER